MRRRDELYGGVEDVGPGEEGEGVVCDQVGRKKRGLR